MTGYTRQRDAETGPGLLIRASDLDAEFNQVQAAFNNSTGHTHTGAAGEGGRITEMGPTGELIVNNSSAYPKTNATYNLGSSTFKWNQLYIADQILPNGKTAAAPSYAFINDTDTGMFNGGADILSFSTGGSTRFTVNTSDLTSTVPFVGTFGTFSNTVGAGGFTTTTATIAATSTAALPAYSFTGDLNTGIYSGGADEVSVSTGGTERFTVRNSGVTSTVTINGTTASMSGRVNAGGGSAAAPSHSFVGDLDTGLYSTAANTLSVSTGGSARANISSAGIESFVPYITKNAGSASAPAFNINSIVGVYSGAPGEFNISNNILEIARFTSTGAKVTSAAHGVYHEGNILGAVGLGGGFPTGAIIEDGSNANGSYTKFANGTMICRHEISITDVNTAAGALYRSGDNAWTFPAAFATNVPVVSGNLSTADSWIIASASTTSANVRAVSYTSKTGPFTIYVIAVGSWV